MNFGNRAIFAINRLFTRCTPTAIILALIFSLSAKAEEAKSPFDLDAIQNALSYAKQHGYSEYKKLTANQLVFFSDVFLPVTGLRGLKKTPGTDSESFLDIRASKNRVLLADLGGKFQLRVCFDVADIDEPSLAIDDHEIILNIPRFWIWDQWNYSQKEALIQKFLLGSKLHPRIPYKSNPKAVEERLALGEPAIVPKQIQLDAFAEIDRTIANKGKELIVVAPTGSGKTEIMLHAVHAQLEAYKDQPGLHIVFANRIDNVNDLANAISLSSKQRTSTSPIEFKVEKWGGTSQRGKIQPLLNEVEESQKPVVLVTTIQSLLPSLDEARADETFSSKFLEMLQTVVVDEIHHIDAPETAAFEKSIIFDRASIARVFGVTATPGPGGLIGRNLHGSYLSKEEADFQTFSIADLSTQLSRAINHGDLSPLTKMYWLDPKEITNGADDLYIKTTESHRAIINPKYDATIWDALHPVFEKFEYGFLTYGSVYEAKEKFASLQKHLQARKSGLKVAIYHSYLPLKEQAKILKQIREKKFNLVITVDKFNESLDLPFLRFLADFSENTSVQKRLQRIGRILRLDVDKLESGYFSVLKFDGSDLLDELHLIDRMIAGDFGIVRYDYRKRTKDSKILNSPDATSINRKDHLEIIKKHLLDAVAEEMKNNYYAHMTSVEFFRFLNEEVQKTGHLVSTYKYYDLDRSMTDRIHRIKYEVSRNRSTVRNLASKDTYEIIARIPWNHPEIIQWVLEDRCLYRLVDDLNNFYAKHHREPDPVEENNLFARMLAGIDRFGPTLTGKLIFEAKNFASYHLLLAQKKHDALLIEVSDLVDLLNRQVAEHGSLAKLFIEENSLKLAIQIHSYIRHGSTAFLDQLLPEAKNFIVVSQANQTSDFARNLKTLSRISQACEHLQAYFDEQGSFEGLDWQSGFAATFIQYLRSYPDRVNFAVSERLRQPLADELKRVHLEKLSVKLGSPNHSNIAFASEKSQNFISRILRNEANLGSDHNLLGIVSMAELYWKFHHTLPAKSTPQFKIIKTACEGFAEVFLDEISNQELKDFLFSEFYTDGSIKSLSTQKCYEQSLAYSLRRYHSKHGVLPPEESTLYLRLTRSLDNPSFVSTLPYSLIRKIKERELIVPSDTNARDFAEKINADVKNKEQILPNEFIEQWRHEIIRAHLSWDLIADYLDFEPLLLLRMTPHWVYQTKERELFNVAMNLSKESLEGRGMDIAFFTPRPAQSFAPFTIFKNQAQAYGRETILDFLPPSILNNFASSEEINALKLKRMQTILDRKISETEIEAFQRVFLKGQLFERGVLNYAAIGLWNYTDAQIQKNVEELMEAGFTYYESMMLHTHPNNLLMSKWVQFKAKGMDQVAPARTTPAANSPAASGLSPSEIDDMLSNKDCFSAFGPKKTKPRF